MNQEFDIVMYINFQEVNTSSVNSQVRMCLINALAESMKELGKLLVVTHYRTFLSLPLSKPRRLLRQLGESLVQERSENLYIFTPLIPLSLRLAERIPLMMGISRQRLESLLRQTLQSLGFTRETSRIAWVSHPYHLYYQGLVQEHLLIYECYDEHTLRNWKEPDEHLVNLEKELARRSDIVLATARALLDKLTRENKRTYYFPNGVDFELFNQASRPSTPIAVELIEIPKPRIGFMGHLCDWFDINLLHEIILRKREWSFVFTGQIASNIQEHVKPLKNLPNTFFLGWQDYYLIPQIMKGLDVLIMPYKVNDFTQKVNPMKMYQFMAAGVPVVSTPIAEVLNLRDIIEVADGANDFIAAIERNIVRRDLARLARGIALVKGASWDARARQAIELIQERQSAKHIIACNATPASSDG